MVNFPPFPSCTAVPGKGSSSGPVSLCRRWRNNKATVPFPLSVTYEKKKWNFMLEITTNWKLDQVFSIPVPWVKNLKKTIGMVFWTYWSGKSIWWLRITETNFTMTTSSTSRSITRYPTPFCDTGKIVLLENRPLLKFIRKFFWDSSDFYFTHPAH